MKPYRLDVHYPPQRFFDSAGAYDQELCDMVGCERADSGMGMFEGGSRDIAFTFATSRERDSAAEILTADCDMHVKVVRRTDMDPTPPRDDGTR